MAGGQGLGGIGLGTGVGVGGIGVNTGLGISAPGIGGGGGMFPFYTSSNTLFRRFRRSRLGRPRRSQLRYLSHLFVPNFNSGLGIGIPGVGPIGVSSGLGIGK